MDAHCYWINNCVGVNNRKFYILFLFYTCLTSIMVVILGLDAIYCIMFQRNEARRAWKNDYFWYYFWAIVTMFGLGCYFMNQTFQLLREQLDSIAENQSFIDDLKD